MNTLGIYTKFLKVSECSYDKFAMLHKTADNKNYLEYYNWLPWFVWCGPITTVLDPLNDVDLTECFKLRFWEGQGVLWNTVWDGT